MQDIDWLWQKLSLGGLQRVRESYMSALGTAAKASVVATLVLQVRNALEQKIDEHLPKTEGQQVARPHDFQIAVSVPQCTPVNWRRTFIYRLHGYRHSPHLSYSARIGVSERIARVGRLPLSAGGFSLLIPSLHKAMLILAVAGMA